MLVVEAGVGLFLETIIQHAQVVFAQIGPRAEEAVWQKEWPIQSASPRVGVARAATTGPFHAPELLVGGFAVVLSKHGLVLKIAIRLVLVAVHNSDSLSEPGFSLRLAASL